MPRQIITTPNAPSSPLYSQGVKAGSHLFVSGTTGIDPSTGALAGATIQEQTAAGTDQLRGDSASRRRHPR